MREFTDNKGRVWVVELNVTTLKRARDLAGVNLTTILDAGGLEAFLDDAFQKADVLYAVCRDQAQTLGVTDEEFGRGLTGDAMDAAEVALLAEIANFSPLRRPLIERVAAQHQKLRAETDKQLLAAIDDPETEKAILARVHRTLENLRASELGSIFTDAPVSSA